MSAKNKFRYCSFPATRKHLYHLEPGLSGFLCTCNSKLKEKDCVRESYNILREFADKLFGPEDKEYDKPKEETNLDEAEEDIEEALKKEVASIKVDLKKKPEARRFQVIKSGANGIVFIQTTVPDPVKLAHMIMTSLSDVQKSKYLLRLLPVEITCKAYVEDICKACDPLFEKYFSEEKTFAIVYNHRNNSSLKRDDLIEKVAAKVCEKNENNKTNLKHPQLTVLIEVIRNICCISVVPDFYALKKYNLMELAAQNNAESENEQNEQNDQNETCQTEPEK